MKNSFTRSCPAFQAVEPHVVADAQRGDPGDAGLELELGRAARRIEAEPEAERREEDHQAHDERPGLVLRALAPGQDGGDERAGQREEDDHVEEGAHG